MDREQLCMLKELMALEFTVLEFHLYLDTHPTDQRALMEYNSFVQQLSVLKRQYQDRYRALMEYNSFVQQLSVLKRQYQDRYGPLTWQEPSAYPWQWINEPWPWEICYE